MDVGVQLYGVAAHAKNEPEELLRQLQTLGANGVEPCIVFGELGGFEKLIWTPEDMRRTAPMLGRYGFKACSCHVFTADLAANEAAICEFAAQYGIGSMVLPCPSSTDVAVQKAKAVQKLAAVLDHCGTKLLIHNEANELTIRIGEISLYEWFVKETGTGMQVDVGWLTYAGYDVECFLQQHQQAVRSLHYKELSADIPLPYDACIRFAKTKGIPQIVDQDTSSGSILSDIARMIARIKA